MKKDRKKFIRAAISLGVTVVIAVSMLTGCQSVAKSFGGSYTLKLEPNRKLVNITWKDSELWFLTREMDENDKAETFLFQESSNFGMLEGTVKVVETKEGN